MLPNKKMLERVYDVVSLLQSWLEENAEHDNDRPDAGFMVSANGLITVNIGEVEVWNSLADPLDSLTDVYCRNTFLEQIERFAPYLAIHRPPLTAGTTVLY